MSNDVFSVHVRLWQLLCQIFSRIADLHNIEIVLKELTPFEAACLYSRVGWLSIYNPCKPEVTSVCLQTYSNSQIIH